MKKTLLWSLKALLGLVLAAWFLLRSDLQTILEAVESIPLSIFFGLALVQLFSFWLNALKWNRFLPQTSLPTLFKLILIGHYYSMLIPGQIAGEAVKIYRIGRQQGSPATAARTVVLDRITGVTSVLAVALAGAVISGSKFSELFLPWFLAALVTVAAGFALWVGVGFHLARSSGPGNSGNCCREKGKPALQASSHWLREPKFIGSFLWAQGLGIGVQLLCVAIVKILSSELGIFLAFADWCWIFGAVSLVVFIPVTIAGVGLREAGFVFLTGMYNVPMEAALSLSLAVFCLQLFPAGFGALLELAGKSIPAHANGQAAVKPVKEM